jgi:4-amino-4-deoxychorismate lyase
MPRRSDMRSDRGIFETLAIVNGRPRLLERHLQRLFEGCARLGMRAPIESVLVAEICAQAALPGAGVVKVIVTQSGGAAHDTQEPTVRAEPPRPRPLEWWRDGASIITCRTRLAVQPQLAGLKLLDRSAHLSARAEWTADSIAEGLMLDADGRLVSGTMTNVYAVIDGVISTPAITRCGVAGVVRAALLDNWQAGGQSTVIRDLDPAELKGASEIFLSNALIGVWPVRSLDGHGYSFGPVTRAAQAWVQRIVKDPPLPPLGRH